jgi:small subunit ribosomal protein S20
LQFGHRLEATLANTPSAKKRMRQNPKRQMRNKRIRTRARTHIKNARAAIDSDPQAAEAATQTALREVVHRNNAARRKSRLMKHLNRAKSTS